MDGTPVLKQVLHAMRRCVVQGVWPADSRLPTRTALARSFSTSPATIQHVIQHLSQQGTLVTRKKAGTFVTSHPPELHRFALVTHRRAQSSPRPEDACFVEHLIQSAKKIAARCPGWHMDVWSSEDPEVQARALAGNLAGMVFFGPEEFLPDCRASGIPIAAFRSNGQNPISEVSIQADSASFLESGIRSLVARGHTRIAVIDNSALIGSDIPTSTSRLLATISRLGGECRPSWLQCVNAQNPTTIHQLAVLLLDRPPAARPTGFLLVDDHMRLPMFAALKSLDLSCPDDVAVAGLAHSHHQETAGAHAYIRIGFDTDAFMLAMLELLSRWRRGEPAAIEYHIHMEELAMELPGLVPAPVVEPVSFQ